MALPHQPPYLMPELVEEILLRVPPEDPALLVRASLACKPWRRLLCDPAFRRRYLAFHRTPPLLGFLHNRWRWCGTRGEYDVVPGFFATTTPSPFPEQAFDGYDDWCVVDCRHGRVLFEASSTSVSRVLVVWDPTTGELKWLPEPPTPCWRYTAAVLCALHGHGCDHLDCRSGPFFVALVESDSVESSVRAHLYSSEAGSWNTSPGPGPGPGFNVAGNQSTLIGNDIYFVTTFGSWEKILRYNLGKKFLSFFHAPAAEKIPGGFFLVPMEDGGLGTIQGTRLCLWSRNIDPDVVAGAGWVQCSRAIELQNLIPCIDEVDEAISADDFGIIFVATHAGVFTIDLESSRTRQVGKTMRYYDIYPLMTFYTPDSRCGWQLTTPYVKCFRHRWIPTLDPPLVKRGKVAPEHQSVCA